MPNMVAETLHGNFVFLDHGGHLRRVLHAIGPGVVEYIAQPWHFAGDAAVGWDLTAVGTSVANASDEAEAAFKLVTGGTENNGVSMQLLGSVFQLTSEVDLYLGLCCKINDATQTDLFAGLSVTDTSIFGGVTDRIGFEKLDGATGVAFVVEQDSTQTAVEDITTLEDDSYVTLELYWSGGAGKLQVFVDGAEVTAPSLDNLPNDVGLRLSLEFLTGEGQAQTLTVKWLRAFQISG